MFSYSNKIILTIYACVVLISLQLGSLEGFDVRAKRASSTSDCTGGSCTCQSPIDIVTSNITTNTSIGSITFTNYASTVAFTATNDGSTIKYTPTVTQDNTTTPYLTFSNSSDIYFLTNFQFRWGSNDSVGSEHTIDGTQYPLEVQLLHTSILTGTNTVVSFIFTNGTASNNTAIDSVLTDVYSLLTNGSSITTNVTMSTTFAPTTAALSTFYRYDGSLTTSPYSEGVTWNVYNTIISLSSSQIAVFRQTQISDNYRSVQALNNRTVYLATSTSFANKLEGVDTFFIVKMSSIILFSAAINY